MRVNLLISVGLVSSLLLSGCAINRAASLRMLSDRAEYDAGEISFDSNLEERGMDGYQNSPIPTRTRPKVAAVWIYPTDTAGGDYFWGGWLSVLLERDEWVPKKRNGTPKAKAIEEISKESEKKLSK